MESQTFSLEIMERENNRKKNNSDAESDTSIQSILHKKVVDRSVEEKRILNNFRFRKYRKKKDTVFGVEG